MLTSTPLASVGGWTSVGCRTASSGPNTCCPVSIARGGMATVFIPSSYGASSARVSLDVSFVMPAGPLLPCLAGTDDRPAAAAHRSPDERVRLGSIPVLLAVSDSLVAKTRSPTVGAVEGAQRTKPSDDPGRADDDREHI